MRASIPTAIVDNTYENFPEGTYVGSIDGAEIRDVKDDGSWITMKLSIGSITPADGTEDPGRKRFTGELTLVNDENDVRTMTNFGQGAHFGLVRTAGLLAGLAEGLGVAERTPQGVQVDLDAVISGLADGQFAGEQVAFEVTHYTSKSNGKTYDQYAKFGPAS